MGAATAGALAALAACGDLALPGLDTLATADLVILRVQSAAPQPHPLTFYVSNARRTTRRLVHPDGFNTLYVELDFPSGSLASVGGTALGPNDSVQVRVDPRPGEYGLTLSPSGLAFVAGREPTALFGFATYADASVADPSTRYASRLAYLDALTLWEEVSPGLWRRVAGSGTAGTDAVRGRVSAAGRVVVAAPR